MAFRSLTLFVFLVLSGCATCQRHPVACSIAGAIVVGSVAATVAANSGHDQRQPPGYHPVCAPNCPVSR
jgi:hypothetical protein